MEYIRSKKYETKEWMSKIMGPNPIKLEEELLLSWTPEQLDYMCNLTEYLTKRTF